MQYNKSNFINGVAATAVVEDRNEYVSIFQQYEKVIIDSLITSFGLDFIIQDQHGGDVDTIHNVRQIGVDELMKYKNIDHPEAIMTLNSFKDKISINDVKFAYSETSSVLNGLNIEIHKGEKIGICGETGDGKSTLLKLLNRFYIPNSGSISIDGVDINLTTLKSYRHMVGSVHQENIIFPGTIKQNILFAVPNATEYELIEACRKSEILDFVLSLPGKFDTIVGPRGLTLSGGQKQRIALARLFLQDPEIILLDEATSALDNETENLIQDTIKKLDGKTIITVAHRLSTIKDCDKIYVMKGGIVAECGTHEELMHAHGLYFSMNK